MPYHACQSSIERATMTGGCGRLRPVEATQLSGELTRVLVTKDQLAARIAELAAEIDRDYAGKELLLVGVLNGAVMVMADLSRALSIHCQMDWMAVSSYGSGSKSSGVVRILKDLSTDVTGMHVLLVETSSTPGSLCRTW
jgi:hypoxanthine phosphoribosyltransferase